MRETQQSITGPTISEIQLANTTEIPLLGS